MRDILAQAGGNLARVANVRSEDREPPLIERVLAFRRYSATTAEFAINKSLNVSLGFLLVLNA